MLRVVGPQVPPLRELLYHSKVIHRYDRATTLEGLLDLCVFGFRPNHNVNNFITNSRSLLTTEYKDEKAPDTVRVLAFGDSFTFYSRAGYQHTWHYRLQQELKDRIDADVEVLNFGMPAVGPEFELRLWEIEGSRLQPDLVVLAFTVGSQFTASIQGKRERTWSDRVALASYTYRFFNNLMRRGEVVEAVGRHNRIGGTVDVPEGVGGVPVADVVPGFRFEYDRTEAFFSRERYLRIVQARAKTFSKRGLGERLDSVAETLLEFRDQVVDAGAEFVVLICPDEIQVNPELREEMLEHRGLRASDFDWDLPQRCLRELFEREGIRYLDPLDGFRDAAQRQSLYQVNDSHWNDIGHSLAGRALADYLTTPPDSGEVWPWLR